jgi:hypothetical protein
MSEEIINLPVKHIVPDDVLRLYPTGMVIQHNQHEFDIYLFDTKDPLLTGTPQENLKQLQSLDSVEAICIARITITATRMPEFLSALNNNFDKFFSRFVGKFDNEDFEHVE